MALPRSLGRGRVPCHGQWYTSRTTGKGRAIKHNGYHRKQVHINVARRESPPQTACLQLADRHKPWLAIHKRLLHNYYNGRISREHGRQA